jgi:proteasome lid subunit RPN8/RPN11
VSPHPRRHAMAVLMAGRRHAALKVVYHSHPNAGAFFSAEDIRGAFGRAPDATTEPQ